MCSGGGGTPSPDPLIGIAAQQNADTAKEALDWYKNLYEDNKPRQAEADAISRKLFQQQFDIADKNNQRADEQWSYWKNSYQPVERQTIMDSVGSQYLGADDRAKLAALVNGNSGLSGDALTLEMDRISRAASEGAASQAVTQSQGLANSAYAQQARQLSRSGMDPARMAAAAAGLAQNQTLTNVSAANQARTTAQDKYTGLRTGVANFGRNMPNTAGQAFGLATQAGNSAGQNSQIGNNYNNSQAGLMGQGFNTAISGYSSAMQGLNQQYGNQVSAYGQQQQANATSAAGLGSLVGMGLMAFS